MQKADFIKAVTDRLEQKEHKISQQQVKLVVDAALEEITDQLKQGEKVTLTGFGTFEVRPRQERDGVNPQTREKIRIPATKTPGFSASSTLKKEIAGKSEETV